jgi:hypothetical protein
MLKDGPLVLATRASRCADSGGARPVLGPHSRNRVWNHARQPSFLAGGAIVLLGVYLGAVYRPRRQLDESAGEAARA